MQTRCLFCGNQIDFVFVHGHYQCPVCNTNALPCCDGDNCNNIFLTEPQDRTNALQPASPQQVDEPKDQQAANH